jgi:uncharacterized protein (TIRG00374 family)
MNHKTIKEYRHQVLAGLLFIIVVLIAVVAVTGVDALSEKLGDFLVWIFVPVFLLKCVNWALRYCQWRYFLGVLEVRTVRGLGIRPIPSLDKTMIICERDSAVLWLSGLALGISPGKLGELLKALVLKRLTGLDFSRGAPVVFVERLAASIAIIPLTTITLLLTRDTFDTGGVSLSYIRAVLVGVTIVLISGMVLFQNRPLALRVLDRIKHWPGLRQMQGALYNLYTSGYELLKLHHLIPATLLSASGYTCDCIGFFLLLRGLGVEGGWRLLGQASFIMGFSVIVASISTLPGGAGGRELTMGSLLTSVIGLTKTDAGTATFLISLFQVWLGVLMGLVTIAVFRNTLLPPALEDDIAAYQAMQQAGENLPVQGT